MSDAALNVKGMSEGTDKVKSTSTLLRVMNAVQVSNAPAINSERNNGEQWVRFGRHNLFPEFIRGLADNCAPLDACVETMAQYIEGDGFEFLNENDEPIEAARVKWEELCGEEGVEGVLHGWALDTALMNSHAAQIIRSNIGIASVGHLDVCRVRSGKKVDGKVKEFFFSSNWERHRDPGYRPETIPAFGMKGNKELLYRRGYKQLRDYYGEPHWLAVMADAEVLTRIPVFNRTQIEGGFKPSTHIHVTRNSDNADISQLDEQFEMVYSGENGKPTIVTVGSVDEKLIITKLERGDHAGELDATRKVSKEEIYHSYGIPPILMGIDVSTGMSGKGMAITETLSMFQTMKVAPMQKPIAHTAKMILKECGIDVPIVRIKQRIPFEPAKDAVLARQAFIGTVTVDEYRIANGYDPFNDQRGKQLICEALKGAGNLDPAVANA